MLTRRSALATTAAALLAAGVRPAVAHTAAPVEDQGPALDAFFEQSFERRLDRSPQLAASLGDPRNAGAWDDPSLEFAAQSDAIALEEADRLRNEFDLAALDPARALSAALFLDQAERVRASAPFRQHSYHFNQMFGAQSRLPAFLINQHRVRERADAEAYIERLEGFGAVMDALVARTEAAAAAGISPPRFVYDYVTSDCRNVLADNPLIGDFAAKVDALDLREGAKRRLKSRAERAIARSVAPAYERALEALTGLQARARDTDGVWDLPDGEAYYAERLANQTTTTMTADEVHELGLSEVARIQGEMRTIMATVGFGGDLPDFYRFMETDERFYLPGTPEGKAEYITRAKAALDQMSARAPEFFNRLPRAGFEVRPVEAFREQSAGLAFYQRPSADGARPGIYYANTYDMRALPLYQLEALAYHEAIPGHHFQIALQQELEGVPRFRRFGGYTAYSEGWALYCELLAKEMGFYQDPYSDFGRLTLEVRRAIRLVVDTGLHAKRWPRSQAIQYILDNQPGGEDQARKDIDRYIVMPGQATAYKIGMNTILDLRSEAKAAMGEAIDSRRIFDIRAFHDVVLSEGAMPLNMLAERVRAFAGV